MAIIPAEGQIYEGIGLGQAQVGRLPQNPYDMTDPMRIQYDRQQQELAKQQAEAVQKQKDRQNKLSPDFDIKGIIPADVKIFTNKIRDYVKNFQDGVLTGDDEWENIMQQEQLEILGAIQDSKERRMLYNRLQNDLLSNRTAFKPEYINMFNQLETGAYYKPGMSLADSALARDQILNNPMYRRNPVEYKMDKDRALANIKAGIENVIENDAVTNKSFTVDSRRLESNAISLLNDLAPEQKIEWLGDLGFLNETDLESLDAMNISPQEKLDLVYKMGGDEVLLNTAKQQIESTVQRSFSRTEDENRIRNSDKSKNLIDRASLQTGFKPKAETVEGIGNFYGNRYVFGKEGGGENSKNFFNTGNLKVYNKSGDNVVNQVEGVPTAIIEDTGSGDLLIEIATTYNDPVTKEKLVDVKYVPYKANKALMEQEYGGFENIKNLATKGKNVGIDATKYTQIPLKPEQNNNNPFQLSNFR